ncbi:MAG: methyltransferase domain-containing protein [Candidatus Dadabacteria bacterium]|nr:MAG: methyltransferase domain-containing protein [Candidatus Dadabacteria bacterium]
MHTARDEGAGWSPGGWAQARLSDRDFRRIARFMEEYAGIRLPPAKRLMVEGRVRRRLRELGIPAFEAYCDHVFGPEGADERLRLVDALTTNKTDFFREPEHFRFLVSRAVPARVQAEGAGIRRPLAIWSAGCSTGEEPYTLAMVLLDAVASRLPGFRFEILATDLSTRVLEVATRAVYPEERIGPVPPEMRRRHLLRSKDPTRGLVRMAPHVRRLVRFRRLNLMEEFRFREPMDIVFCRNVMIYFDRATQEELLGKFWRVIAPGGYLFLGHSETLTGMADRFRSVAPTVYERLP